VYAIGPSFVGRCSHDTAAAGPPDDDRLAPKLRPTHELDRHEERVHVDMQDRSVHDAILPVILLVVSDSQSTALPDATPPVWARVAAVLAIIIGGVAGGLIGWSVFDLQCTDGCPTTAAIGGIVGALSGAIGLAVVAVLSLRAMAEWKAIENRDRARRERGLE